MMSLAPRFALGLICMTPKALFVLACGTDKASRYIARHVSGDWGDLDDHDKHQNDLALKHDLRILSAYTTTSGEKLWIITEADRSITSILLPEEY